MSRTDERMTDRETDIGLSLASYGEPADSVAMWFQLAGCFVLQDHPITPLIYGSLSGQTAQTHMEPLITRFLSRSILSVP